MPLAWKILLALTLARFSMGFQFQAVPALSASLMTAQNLSFAALGTLIGAYLLPGVVAALSGGWLGQRFGDARIFFVGLILMVVGGVLGAVAHGFELVLAARLIAGVGAVALNVMVTKMAADWFKDRDDLPPAMGVLVSSWPAGIALATLSLPFVAQGYGLKAALFVPVFLCAAALILVGGLWREPDRHQTGSHAQRSKFTRVEITLVVLAGTIWGIYNAALVGAIAWLPGLLESHDISVVAAAASTSVIGWAAIVSVAAGGWIAAKCRNRDMPAFACFAGSGIIMMIMPWLGAGAGAFVVVLVLGLFIGLAAAMNMTLPLEATDASKRTMAMGIYFAIYYGLMGVAPWALGGLRDVTENSAAPIYAAATLLFLSLLLWLAFRFIQRASQPSA